jgi:hypothetical protein
MRPNDLSQVDNVSQRLATEVPINQVKLCRDHRVGLTVVVHLKRGDANQGGRMAPEQVDEGERLSLVTRDLRIKLDGPRNLFELVPRSVSSRVSRSAISDVMVPPEMRKPPGGGWLVEQCRVS